MKKFLLLVPFTVLLVAVLVLPKRRSAPSSPLAPPPQRETVLATAPKETEVKNLDGSKKLLLVDGTSVYVFDNKGKRLLFTGTNLTLPNNSWAPNDTYVFLKQTAPTVTYLAFKTSGEQFAANTPYVDIGVLFAERLPERKLRDATGWDGPGLIHIQSDGPSFWFDVTSQTFIQLWR